MTDQRSLVVTGEAIEALRVMRPSSVDAIVTDPPYGLSKEPDAAEVLRHWLNGDDYKHRGSGFMGKSWDSFVPGPTVWRECLRVLKPGGHMLVFGGTRSFDLLTMAIRLAGFEIRDTIAWMYGQGFPKSLDVSKAIDKAAGAEREVVGRAAGAASQNTQSLGAFAPEYDATLPATPESARWDGWGTALKPAFEPIVVARKPLIGTVAGNVLAHGTGALNIDGCRIGTNGETWAGNEANAHEDYSGKVFGEFGRQYAKPSHESGRWPANVVMDGEAAAILDAQTGELHSQDPVTRKSGSKRVGVTGMGTGTSIEYAGRGGASRFFYCAKTSSAERSAGLDDKNTHPTVKPVALMRWLVRLVTPPGGRVLDPFCGSGTTGIACTLEGVRFVGVDKEPEYVALAERRIAWWTEHGENAVKAGRVKKLTAVVEDPQLGLLE